MGRLAELLADGERMDWPSLVAAASAEIEDLRGTRTLPSPLVRWVRDVVGRWPR
jgi:hypothetical protein